MFFVVQATRTSLLTANQMDLLLCGPIVKAAPGEASKRDHTLDIIGTQMCEEIKKLPCGFFRLTAYVAKVFSMANNLVAVPDNMICEAVKFLILKTQQPDGMFKEVGTMIHGEMIVRFPSHFIFIVKKD